VDAGEVPVSRVDDAALRIVRQQVRFGEERNTAEYGPEMVASAEHRALAREAAAKGIVLLKNRDCALPLTGVRRVAVIGRLAAIANTGDTGSSSTRPPYVVTPLEGIRAAAVAEGAIVDYDDGADATRAVELARAADVAVLVIGYSSEDEGEYEDPTELARLRSLYPPPGPGEGELAQGILARVVGTSAPGTGGDRDSLSVTDKDEALIAAVAAASSRTVVAIMTGSAVITERWRHDVAALLILWYPGMEGGHAFADILFGAVNPSGRLPCSFPAREEDLPSFDRDATEITYDFWHGYRKLDRDGGTLAFPFGFGLSYTHFALSELRLNGTDFPRHGSVRVSVAVANTGDVAGEEVVQLYIEVEQSAVLRAARDLRGFARISLAPGETRVVTLEIPIRDLAYYDEVHGWIVEEVGYTVVAARHSCDPAALRASFRVSSSDEA
jgi:beta-glucosidase